MKVLYTYNDTDQLTKVENRKSDNTVINSFEYTVDALGNRTRLTEANGDYTNYAYDNIYQLLSEVKKDSSDSELYNYAYTYDNAGNRATMNVGGATTDYTYDANNRLLTAGDVRFGYDAGGNTLRKTNGSISGAPVTEYQYDFANNLTKIVYADGRKNYFEYNGGGIRQSKRDTTHAVRFIYNGIDVLFEIDPATQQTAAAYLQGIHGQSKQHRSNQDHWYLLDGLGSTRALTDTSQRVTDTYSYEAFGNIRSSTGTTPNPFQYVGTLGYYADDDSGLMLLTERYYNPSIGRFTACDPIARMSEYTYVGNRPLNWVDPDGLVAIAIAPVAAGGAVGIAGAAALPIAIGVVAVGAGILLLSRTGSGSKAGTKADTDECDSPETCESKYPTLKRCEDYRARDYRYNRKQALRHDVSRQLKRKNVSIGGRTASRGGSWHWRVTSHKPNPYLGSAISVDCCQEIRGVPKKLTVWRFLPKPPYDEQYF